ncbi:MAG TPA: BBP7 family outer membrane beta-barrel protein [Gemmataceae bacterium]|jgi:hypothetical protein|nr:BBP7 family outer membrane beta-barrel protein [Gemmataceae bacterium]
MRRTLYAVLAGCFLAPALASAQTPETESLAGLPAATPADAVPAFVADESTPGQEGQGNRWYGRTEYLLWWLREGRVPPLLTTGSFANGGVLGAADTKVLYGDDRLKTRHDDRFNGIRLALGYWLDAEQDLGVEAGAFFLERDSTYFKATSAGDVLLARPFINALDGSPMSEVIAGPAAGGMRNGGFNGYSRVEFFGQEVNLVAPLAGAGDARLELLAGARFLQMRDRLDLTATGRLLPDQAVLFGLTDHFRADDQFYGGQVGVRAERVLGRWLLSVRGQAALGGTEQVVRAFGDRTYQTPLTKVVQPFGLAVLPSNSGRSTNTDLDAVYEVGANLGYQVTSYLRGFAGYTFLYWNNPVRAGDQVDLVVNPSQLTGPLAGPARPLVPFREDAFWAQGLNAGMEVRW